MANNSEKMNLNAGQAAGQTQERGNQMMDKATNVAQSAKDTIVETGQKMKNSAQGAVDSVVQAFP